MTPCVLHCPVCKAAFDWARNRYGREIGCCSKECHDEAEWRRCLSICGKQYYPDPRRFPEQRDIAVAGEKDAT